MFLNRTNVRKSKKKMENFEQKIDEKNEEKPKISAPTEPITDQSPRSSHRHKHRHRHRIRTEIGTQNSGEQSFAPRGIDSERKPTNKTIVFSQNYQQTKQQIQNRQNFSNTEKSKRLPLNDTENFSGTASQSIFRTQRIQSARRNVRFRQSMPIFKLPQITPDIQNYKEKAINQTLPTNLPSKTYDEILFALLTERKELAKQHKYEEGQKITIAMEFVKYAQIESQKKALQRTLNKEAVSKVNQVNEELRLFDEETERIKGDIEEATERFKEDLIRQQEVELQENEELWRSQEKLKHYNHSSNSLATLKKQINTLTVQARFKEAAEVSIQYEKQKKIEEQASHELMQKDFDEALKLLLKKQQDERDQFLRNADLRMKNFIVQRGIEREHIQNKLKIKEGDAEATEDPEKVWNRTTNIRMDERVKNPSNFAMPSTKMTRKDISDKDIELLTLPPLEIKKNKKIVF